MSLRPTTSQVVKVNYTLRGPLHIRAKTNENEKAELYLSKIKKRLQIELPP